MSDATNDFVNNLLGEEDANSIKLQKLDDAQLLQIDKRGGGNKESFKMLKLILQII